MGYRHPNPRLVKIHRNYSVEEIARRFCIHKNTVRNWLKQGLAAIDDQRPMLILGRDLSRFLRERRQRTKQSCGPGRMYCIACRNPKAPAGNMVDCIPTSPSAGNLCGICPDCDRLMYRRVNLTDERVPTLEQIRHLICMMPAATEIERRDRALIAFTILTGVRDGATASLKLKHLDIDQGVVDQDAREVKTKFSKSFATLFFPVGDDIRQVVVDWVTYLRQEKLWSLDDPLFPATKIVVGDSRHFEASGLARKHWSSAGPIRKIFKDSFAASRLPYFNPHSFRKTLALLGGQICKSPEQYKAWSQNLGHENVLTTFSSYGDVARHRQAEIIRALGKSEQPGAV